MFKNINSSEAAFIILIIGAVALILEVIMVGSSSSATKISLSISTSSFLIISAIKGK